MKKISGFRMLLVICFLLSLSLTAYSDGLYNESFDLNFTESKTTIKEEVVSGVGYETLAEVNSAESKTSSLIFLFILMIMVSVPSGFLKRRLHTVEIRADPKIKAA